MKNLVKLPSGRMLNKSMLMGLLYAATLAVMVLPSLGRAAARNGQRNGERNGQTPTKLSTTMSFSGSRVGGQYQIPSEATAKIENEKPIEELLGLRTQFRDRMKQDEERK